MNTTPVYDLFWKYAAERQAMYLRRLSGQPRPWSSDPIFERYRFTNVYRASDRVTQYLIRNVIPWDVSVPFKDVFVKCILFRTFNKIETWEALRDAHCVSALSFDVAATCRVLDRLRRSGKAVYNSAYIMPSGSREYGSVVMHRNHVRLLDDMLKRGVPRAIQGAGNLGTVVEILRSFPSIGPFLSFQYALDLNYSPRLSFDENDFVQPGPGAVDGIRKMYSHGSVYSAGDVIRGLVDVQDAEFARLGIDFPGLFGRKLTAVDVEHLLCEVSKYSRVSHPEFSKKGRTAIKKKFTASCEPVPMPWFPPKWGLNQKVLEWIKAAR